MKDEYALARRLRKYADKRGWTNVEIAERLGLKPQSCSRVSTWLSGRQKPGLANLERLAKIFGVPLRALLED